MLHSKRAPSQTRDDHPRMLGSPAKVTSLTHYHIMSENILGRVNSTYAFVYHISSILFNVPDARIPHEIQNSQALHLSKNL